ncbi:ribosomal protection-like ABC-F family protein [Bacillus sp. EAC]|uniref:ribosomal protection-like ABC-F family protein n=1 Tax=Bacillus sp. EAC TaxID=1978338 RepID=UPI000B453744|nr:ABC-F type ribosomal protection protein [Bacillus sp. EAC]
MIACSIDKISKMFGGNSLFTELSFQINQGSRVGLVGANGSGKTSIFKLLTGVESPDSGSIHFKKGLKIGYLAQIPLFSDEMTSRDVLLTVFEELRKIESEMKLLEMDMMSTVDEGTLNQMLSNYGALQEKFSINGGYEMEASLSKIANGLGIVDLLPKQFSSLSGGEKTKVGLGIVLLQQPDLLLLDEPTNHLDLSAIEWLGTYLKEYEGTIIVISHDRYFLDDVVNQILELEDGEITVYHTNYSQFVIQKEERLLKEFQAYEEQQKKIQKMKETIKRLREWANQANPPNAGLHRRARSMEKALERIERLKRPVLQKKKMAFQLEGSGRSGKDVIIAENLSKSFDDKTLFQQINFSLYYGDRAVIIGNNGTGKSTLLKMILGKTSIDEGKLKLGSNIKVGYLSQHYEAIQQENTVIEEFREEVHVPEGEARNILAGFLFYGYMVYRKVSQLSGGERMRLRLAQLMYQDINLLIVDEPTNHLDIESREVLEDALEKFKGTILSVSHDRYFINKLFSKIYWLEDGAIHEFIEDYQLAKEKMSLRRMKPEKQPKIIRNEKQIKTAREQVRNIEDIESEINALEQKISELNKLMMDETDIDVLQSLHDEKVNIEVKCQELYVQYDEYIS